jgi:hypothetical protein
MEKNVFSLKLIVIYLTIYLRNPSFPRTQKQQLPNSLKKPQTSFLESGSMSERPHAHMVYIPTELYIGLFKKMGSLEIGESAAILDALNEDLHNRGFIDDETYLRFKERYQRKLIDVVREKTQESSIKVEVSSARMEIQKGSGRPQRSIDYSKLTDEELLRRYQQAILSNDVVAVNVIQGVAHSRGFKFKVDDVGNVQVVSVGIRNE